MSSLSSPVNDASIRGRGVTLLGALTLAVAFSSCGRDAQQTYDAIFSEPVKLNSIDRREFRLTQESGRYRYPDVDNPDGTVTRVLWLQNGQSAAILEMAKGHPSLTALKQATPRPNFFTDPLDGNNKPTNEGLVLVGTREAVEDATKLITHLLTSLPLIEIEARIVEVRESDEFGLGTDLFLLDRKDHTYDPAHPNAPLNPSTSLLDRARTTRGLPALPGSGAIAPGAAPLLLELGTIEGNLQLDFMVQALKMFTKTDVLSAPRIAVLNGFKAEFNAGEDVPILEQNIFGTVVTVSTKYRDVGIKLVVIPSLVSADTIRMSVKTSVQNVTGTVAVFAGSTSVQTPVISRRDATTTVDVHDGAAVVIGGLFTTSKAEARDRVPVLGEIPILNVLFSSTHTEDTRTNLLFFIRPRVISSAGESGTEIITPPPETQPNDAR